MRISVQTAGLPDIPSNMNCLGVAWFRERDWPRWCAIDPDFQPDYDHWLARAEKALKHYRASGIAVRSVYIDPDEFLAWSHKTGAGVGSQARAAYVADQVTQRTEH